MLGFNHSLTLRYTADDRSIEKRLLAAVQEACGRRAGLVFPEVRHSDTKVLSGTAGEREHHLLPICQACLVVAETCFQLALAVAVCKKNFEELETHASQSDAIVPNFNEEKEEPSSSTSSSIISPYSSTSCGEKRLIEPSRNSCSRCKRPRKSCLNKNRELLLRLAALGDIDTLQFLQTKQGIDLGTVRNEQAWSLLNYAIRYGRQKMVEFLIGLAADSVATSSTYESLLETRTIPSGFTPLLMAIECKESTIVRHLISAKADVQAKLKGETNALMLAACFDETRELIPVLLDQKVDINAQV